MTNAPGITLYDHAGRNEVPWHPFTLRTRFALNFQAIPFTTRWLEYPEVEPTLRELGVHPTTTVVDGVSRTAYTLPVIVDSRHLTPAGRPTVVSDMWAIAEYLDRTYPDSTPIIPADTRAFQMQYFSDFERHMLFTLVPAFVAPWVSFINEASVQFYNNMKLATWGTPVNQVCPRGSETWNRAWSNAQNGFSSIAATLDSRNGQGSSFIYSGQVTYGDLIVASWLECIHMVFPDEWETRVRHWDGGRWARHLEQCRTRSGHH